MLDWARSRAVGFSHFISLGNSADVEQIFVDAGVPVYPANTSLCALMIRWLDSVRKQTPSLT
jgi:hypothetical protein